MSETVQLPKRRQAVLESVTVEELHWLLDQHGLMGNAEAAEALDTAQPNVLRLSGLPDPVARVKATRLWIGTEINEYAAARVRRVG